MSKEDEPAVAAAEVVPDKKRRRLVFRAQRPQFSEQAFSASSSSTSTTTVQSEGPDRKRRSTEDPGTEVYEQLWKVKQQLIPLVHDGRKLCRLTEQPKVGSDLETIRSLAARLHTAAPLGWPVAPHGWPLAPLPLGASLPYPSEPAQVPHTLRASIQRPPPPEMRVTREPGVMEGWIVHVRFLPPATAIIFTINGSLPRYGTPATQVHEDSVELKLQLGPGGAPCVYARAVAQNLAPSDTVIVSAPKPPQSAPVVSVATAQESGPETAETLKDTRAAYSAKMAATSREVCLPRGGPSTGRRSQAFEAMRNSILLGRGESDDSSSDE